MLSQRTMIILQQLSFVVPHLYGKNLYPISLPQVVEREGNEWQNCFRNMERKEWTSFFQTIDNIFASSKLILWFGLG
jgi:hypothetical protein